MWLLSRGDMRSGSEDDDISKPQVICVIVLLLIIFLRSRVGLMVTIFKEAGYMVMRMIVILFTPILVRITYYWYYLCF